LVVATLLRSCASAITHVIYDDNDDDGDGYDDHAQLPLCSYEVVQFEHGVHRLRILGL
jgi:hypothetical protein